MPAAARIGDSTSHGPALAPGPGSPDVLIGGKPAWRATPAALAGAIDALSSTMKSFMGKPSLTPASAASDILKITQNLAEVGAKGATAGAVSAAASAASQTVTMNTTNTALTATWTAASAVPGGQPAATVAYTEAIKGVAAAAASAVMAALASVADMHVCPNPSPTPPHGPGFVTKGSASVLINNLPAARQGDKVMETCGGSDPVAVGCANVLIGDNGKGGAGSVKQASNTKDTEAEERSEEESHQDAEAYRQEAAASSPAKESALASVDGPIRPRREQDQTDSQRDDWMGIVLRDFDNEPMPLRPFSVTLTDGRVLSGETDQNGYAKFEGIKPGEGEVEFVEFVEEEGDHSEKVDEGEFGSMYLDEEPQMT